MGLFDFFKKTETHRPAPLTINDLTIDPSTLDLENLLSDWAWALPPAARPVLLTACGDAFCQAEDGAVWFLDATEGHCTEVAPDGQSFREQLADPEFVAAHMLPRRVAALRAAGMRLGPGECYSHQVPLVVGGDDSIENSETLNAMIHFSVNGQLHWQSHDPADGTPFQQFLEE